MPKKKTKKRKSYKTDNDHSIPYLKGVSVQNYKSFNKLSFVDFAPKVNLIFGKNSSGKSSILQALRLFRQSYHLNSILNRLPITVDVEELI